MLVIASQSCAVGVDEIGEHVGQPEFGSPDRAVLGRSRGARARGFQSARAARRAKRVSGCGRLAVSAISSSSCCRKSSGADWRRSRCSANATIGDGSGCAADAEVDAARKERAQHAEIFGDFERAVVRQHHAAAADLDSLGSGRLSARSELRDCCTPDPAFRDVRPPSNACSRDCPPLARGRCCCATPLRLWIPREWEIDRER